MKERKLVGGWPIRFKWKPLFQKWTFPLRIWLLSDLGLGLRILDFGLGLVKSRSLPCNARLSLWSVLSAIFQIKIHVSMKRYCVIFHNAGHCSSYDHSPGSTMTERTGGVTLYFSLSCTFLDVSKPETQIQFIC